MSGMLPGVECARRRRLHQSNRVLLDSPSSPSAYFSSTRKSFFCLYTSNNSSPSMVPIPTTVSRFAVFNDVFCPFFSSPKTLNLQTKGPHVINHDNSVAQQTELNVDGHKGSVHYGHNSHTGSGLKQAYHDEMLGEVAREAKQRLDEKLRARWKPDHKRNGNRPEMGILQRVDLGLKNSGLNKLCCARNSGLEGLRNLEK